MQRCRRFAAAVKLKFLIPGCFALALAPSGGAAEPPVFLNAQLPWHPAVLDAQGKVLAWYEPEMNRGYDRFLRLAWDFLEHRVPVDPRTGTRVYLTYSRFDGATLAGTGWQHNPPSTYAHMMDALLGWYPYSGDREAIDVVRGMLDYQLAHGTTPADWEWPGVPFATACFADREYGRCLRDLPVDYYGGIEPDKVGELGLSYVQFYELSGERQYLQAGLRCADALARHVRPGNATHTPWPFRIDARSGAVLAGEEYGGMIVAPVRLFDELIRIGAGDRSKYRAARDMAWRWLLDYPLNAASPAWDKWSGYYEDVNKDTVNVNDMNSLAVADYLLTQDDPASVDPAWRIHAGYLLDRSRALLGRGPFFGAWAIDEQLRPDGGMPGAGDMSEQASRDAQAVLQQRRPGGPPPGAPSPELDGGPRAGGPLLGTSGRSCCSRAGMVCRSAQWGAINALYFERTGDGQAREDAFRSLNYATYFVDAQGRVSTAGSDFGEYWFEDGYADAGRSFVWAMGAVPEFAPRGEDHLLRSTAVVQTITYGAQAIEYRTFDDAATEVLRLTFRPASITAGGVPLSLRDSLGDDAYTVRDLPGGDHEIRLRHVRSGQVRIRRN